MDDGAGYNLLDYSLMTTSVKVSSLVIRPRNTGVAAGVDTLVNFEDGTAARAL